MFSKTIQPPNVTASCWGFEWGFSPDNLRQKLKQKTRNGLPH